MLRKYKAHTMDKISTTRNHLPFYKFKKNSDTQNTSQFIIITVQPMRIPLTSISIRTSVVITFTNV